MELYLKNVDVYQWQYNYPKGPWHNHPVGPLVSILSVDI